MIRSLRFKTEVLLSILMVVFLAVPVLTHAQGSDIPKKALSSFNEAYKAYQLSDYKEAEKYCKDAIRKYPRYTSAYDLLGRTYKAMWMNEEAIATYKKLLEIDPDYLFAMYQLGYLYYDKQNLDSAEYFFNSMLRYTDAQDQYTNNARKQIDNIRFAREAILNPVDIRPVNLGAMVNSVNEEYSPAMTIDGNSIFFTWRDGSLDLYRANEEIYFSNKNKDGLWSKAMPIGPPINTVENEGAFSVTADGNYIFYTACNREGGNGACDIWLTSQRDGEWSYPQNLGRPVNSRYWESQPCISADGRMLYFASNRPGGYGKIDLYVSTFTDSGWSEPVNLGPDINTPEDEQFPFIHPDGKTLYFSSYGHPGMGNADLFVSFINDNGKFGKPINLGYPINSFGNDWNLIVLRDGKTAIYSSDQIESGQGGMDLYTFILPENTRAQQVSYVKGFVYDKETGKELASTIELIPLDGTSATNTFSDPKTGEFLVALRGNMQYALNVQSRGYLFYSEHFDMPEVPSNDPYVVRIPLQKIKAGNSIVLKNVFFDTDKFDLKPRSEAELNRLYEFLLRNSSVRIEISGHTDNQGSHDHNMNLSRNRALAVYNYLVNKGINPNRMTYAGYAETQPIASNDTEEGRALNRRTEFKIIE